MSIIYDATKEDNPFVTLMGVTAFYPRIDRTYRYDRSQGDNGRTVPCDPKDDGAKYELRFLADEATAKALYKAMKAKYLEDRKTAWPDRFELPFEIHTDEDGNKLYLGKATRKGAYNDEVARPPKQVDAANKVIDSPDFKLTHGSTVNVAVTMVPFAMKGGDHGVSLRLNAVQIIKLAPPMDVSPFEATDGFVYGASDAAEPDYFGGDTDAGAAEPATKSIEDDDGWPEEEPTIQQKGKSSDKATDDVASIIDEWDD